AFLGACPALPVHAGELQGPALGVRALAFDDAGRPVIDQVGELVITEPMPSMPLFFWNDPGGVRYRESYFETYPGVWRHGDWVRFTLRGSAVIYGRSDATLNRHGIRIGTSEIYRAVEAVPGVADSLVIRLEQLGGGTTCRSSWCWWKGSSSMSRSGSGSATTFAPPSPPATCRMRSSRSPRFPAR
ncbi:MAG TPA: hypothetical protein VGR27_03865, partial [Longimicrobiaceae bacterium]|nr:hypothetical protein [Longimicrobiaceae bacterium]